jgi:hypothetical protein
MCSFFIAPHGSSKPARTTNSLLLVNLLQVALLAQVQTLLVKLANRAHLVLTALVAAWALVPPARAHT